jgi:hypothetical protein
MKRHDSESLARTLELGLFEHVQRVPCPQIGADLRRGDIKVHQGGTTWILDVDAVCPRTQRYIDLGSQATPARAAKAYAAINAAKYVDEPNFASSLTLTGVPRVPPRRRLRTHGPSWDRRAKTSRSGA